MANARRPRSRTGTWRWTGTTGRKRKTRSGKVRLAPTPKQPAAKPVEMPSRKHRAPTPVEQRAGVDFDRLEQALNTGVTRLLEQWGAVKAAQIAELADQIRTAGGNPVAVAGVQATARGAETLLAQVREVAASGASGALGEAARQGVTVPQPDTTALEELLASRSQAAAVALARSLSEAAGRKALSLTAPVTAPEDVAKAVSDYLAGLSDTFLRDQFNGLLAAGMNTGRRTVMDAADQPARYYISALLDSNTCAVCRAFDGRQYDTLLALEAQLPFGGNKDCLGGPRCRCTGVAVFDEAAASVQ